MKRILYLTGALITASILLIGCGANKSDLSSETNDFVNMAIAKGCNEAFRNMDGVSMYNKEALSDYAEPLSKLFEQYQNINWTYNLKFKPEVSISVGDNGQAKYDLYTSISKNETFICSCGNGPNKYDIQFTEGKVGVVNGNIFIEENTKLKVNEMDYIYKNGSWINDQPPGKN